MNHDAEQLVLSHMGIAGKVAAERLKSGVPWERLRAGAAYGLVKVALRHDPASGFAFSTLAFRVARQQVAAEVRAYRREACPVSFPVRNAPPDVKRSPLQPWDAADTPAPDVVAEAAEELEQARLHAAALADSLPPPERRVIRARYLDGLERDEAAAALRMSREELTMAELRAIGRLRLAAAGRSPSPAPARDDGPVLARVKAAVLAAAGSAGPLSQARLAKAVGYAVTNRTFRRALDELAADGALYAERASTPLTRNGRPCLFRTTVYHAWAPA